MLTSDQEHYTKGDDKNWMFLRFQAALELDPRFYEAALYGGLYNSIIKDDPLYGNKLYLKGLEQYPDDFKLNYYIGFNFLFDLNDPNQALSYYERILGKPEQVRVAPLLGLRVAKLIEIASNEESKKYLIETLKGMINQLDHAPKIKKALVEKLNNLSQD